MAVERHASEFGSFSDSVSVTGSGRWIHVSGQVALGEDGRLVEGDVARQTRATLDNIERVLRRAGAELRHVVKLTVFLTDLDDYGAFGAVRAEYFGDQLPASAAVQVSGLLLDAEVEIDAVAFVPTDPA
jgi:2-iminobutanoate/2-iminopropanoate deaminase